MKKKAYHHKNLKKALFLACHKLLKKKDPSLISIRSLATEIGVSHSAIYRHFPDREALLEQMATYGFQRLVRVQKIAIQKEKTFERKFLKAGLAYIRFAIQNPYYYKNMFFTKRKNPSEDLKRAMFRSYSLLVGVCRNYLQSKGKSNDPRKFALMAWSLVHGYSDLYLETDFPFSEASAKKNNPTQLAEEILKNIFL
jgi:AcrR family transcriptional regulator